MTAGERTFLELELEVLLRRLKKNQTQIPIEILKSVYRNGYETLVEKICQKACCYVKEVAFDGVGGYYLRTEVAELVEKLDCIMKCPKNKEELNHALFIETDMGSVRDFAAHLHRQVQDIAKEYKNHAGKGE